VPLMMLVAPAVFQVVDVVKSPLVMPINAPAVRWAGLVTPVLSCLASMVGKPDRSEPLPNTPTPSNGINNRPIHRRWEFADAWFEVGVEEVVGVEGVVEVAEVG
jgi:hypothetical protein